MWQKLWNREPKQKPPKNETPTQKKKRQNEVGTIYPVEKIGAIAQKYHIPFLCDASQAVGKIPINLLQAMNLAENVIKGALRIGIGKFTTKEEIEKASSAIASAVKAILSLK